MTDEETYLGDGLYASFDGYQFKLRAPREASDHEVYLEDGVLSAFIAYVGATLKLHISVSKIKDNEIN
jgi:hypothetical protein